MLESRVSDEAPDEGALASAVDALGQRRDLDALRSLQRRTRLHGLKCVARAFSGAVSAALGVVGRRKSWRGTRVLALLWP